MILKSKRKSKLQSRPRSVRKYDNASRAAKAKATQASIVHTYVDLLAERRGGEVLLAEVARKTGISERSIFRFFQDKEALQTAMNEYLLSYFQMSADQLRVHDFINFAKNAFMLFDRYENLTTAYVVSPFGNQARMLFRKKLNQAMISKIATERKIDLTPKTMKRLALVTSLVNAKIWYDLKTENQYSGADMSEAIEWTLGTLLEKVAA